MNLNIWGFFSYWEFTGTLRYNFLIDLHGIEGVITAMLFFKAQNALEKV